jgi:hypothetical protein
MNSFAKVLAPSLSSRSLFLPRSREAMRREATQPRRFDPGCFA